MNLKYKIASESFKYKFGETINFEESLNSFFSAKQDWVAFQLILQADEEISVSLGENPYFTPRISDDRCFKTMKPIKNIRISASLEGLSEASIKMNPIGLIDDDDGIYKADILLHNETVFVEYNRVQSIWVEIFVPKDTKAGLYQGKLKIFTHEMFESEKLLDTVSFEFEVKNFVMPTPKENIFHLDLWQHMSNVARKHEVDLWSDEHFTVIENYVKTLGEIGQKAVTIIASEIPWSSQGSFTTKEYLTDMFEYSMVRVKRDKQGNYSYDFSVMKRYIDICKKYGIDKEIEVFGLINIWVYEDYGYGKVATDYPDAIRIRFFDENDSCYKFITDAQGIKKYIKAIESFFIEEGLIDKVLVVADEPSDIELYKERLSIITDVAPSFKFKAAINHSVFINEFKDKVKDFVPILSGVCEEFELLKEIKDSIQGRLLWYVCCWPEIPNTFIKSPLLESRIIGSLTAFMNFDGFLRWNYTVWPENPREKISYLFPGWKAGDTNFVYPANDGRPLLTLRYKNLKRGIGDFELITKVRQTCEDAEDILEKVWTLILKERDIKQFHPKQGKRGCELYSLDYEDYQKAKEIMIDALSR